MPEATEGHGQVPASNPDFISQILLLEICINVEGEKEAPCVTVLHIFQDLQPFRASECCPREQWAYSLQAEQAGNEESHVRQTTDRGLFEEATKQQVMPI